MNIDMLFHWYTKFLDHMKQIITWQKYETFIHSSIFDKAVFCLGEGEQGLLV